MTLAVFPVMTSDFDGLTWTRKKTPMFATTTQRTVGGVESRLSFRSVPIWKWALSYSYLRSVKSDANQRDFESLIGFICARSGAYDEFLFSDWSDCSVTAENFGTGNGSIKDFQLKRALGSFSENVYDLNSSPSIYVDGALQTVTTHYTISATGLVSFVSAPPDGKAVTWTGTYYWRVRFFKDEIEFVSIMDKLWKCQTVELVSVIL